MAPDASLGEDICAVVNRDGASPFLLVCEHASNHLPAAFGTLGLTKEQRAAHISWDPGALGEEVAAAARARAAERFADAR